MEQRGPSGHQRSHSRGSSRSEDRPGLNLSRQSSGDNIRGHGKPPAARPPAGGKHPGPEEESDLRVTRHDSRDNARNSSQVVRSAGSRHPSVRPQRMEQSDGKKYANPEEEYRMMEVLGRGGYGTGALTPMLLPVQ